MVYILYTCIWSVMVDFIWSFLALYVIHVHLYVSYLIDGSFVVSNVQLTDIQIRVQSSAHERIPK